MSVFWSLYSFQGLSAHRKKYIYRDKPVPAVIVTFYETYVSWNNKKKYKSTIQIKSTLLHHAEKSTALDKNLE